MPNRDGTGPKGKGPRTGRGLGDCPESSAERRGRGLGPCKRGLERKKKHRHGCRREEKEEKTQKD